MSEAIICCSCGSVPDYCRKALSILRPELKEVTTYAGPKVKELTGRVSADSEMGQKLAALIVRRGRYGEYYRWDEQGNVIEAWNLLRTRRIL